MRTVSSTAEVHPAADVQHLPGEVRGFRGSQEGHERGDFASGSEPPVRGAGEDELAPRGREVTALEEVRAFGGPGETTLAVIPRSPSWKASSEVHGSSAAVTAPELPCPERAVTDPRLTMRA